MKPKFSLTRRQFLLITAATVGGLTLSSLERALAQGGLQADDWAELAASTRTRRPPTSTRTPKPPTPTRTPKPPTSTRTQTNTPLPPTSTNTAAPSTETPTPTPVTPPPTPGPGGGRVVHVWSGTATNWSGQQQYWNYANQAKITEMINEGMMTLTATGTLADAWGAILPSYQAGQMVAIKVNFNNSDTGCVGGTDADSIIEPVNAVIAGLQARGVPLSAIYVYDAMRSLPTRFTSRGPAVNYRDNGNSGCNPRAGFTEDSAHQISFLGPAATEYVTDTLYNAHYLINMPLMKPHFIAGVTLGYKHHFGSIDNPGGLHNAIEVWNGNPQNYNPLVDFFRNAHIGGKTVLTVGDGLFCSKEGENRPPQLWESFDYQLPNSLFFSRDPVAIDCVMHDFVRFEEDRPWHVFPTDANRYLQLAAAAGQGVFDHVDDPHTQAYSAIQYIRRNL